MQRRYLHVGDRTIAYHDSAPGATRLKAVVFLHAFPLSGSMWEPQFKHVPDGWRFLAPDMRGFGGSPIEPEPETLSIDDYARDVVDFLGELDIQSAVIGGCSMGGYVALALLRAAPDVIRGLILADTRAAADTTEGRANRRTMLALLEREGPSGVAREILPKLLGKTTLEHSPTTESNLRRIIKQQSTPAIRGAILRMMDRPDSTKTVQALQAPTLVVVGEEDTLTPRAEAEKLAAALPNAELVVIARAGHLSNLEQPDAFNAVTTNFLSRL